MSAKGSRGVRETERAAARGSRLVYVAESSSRANCSSSLSFASLDSRRAVSSAMDEWAASHSFRADATRDSSPARFAVLESKPDSRELFSWSCSFAMLRARSSRTFGRVLIVSEKGID